MAAVAVLLAANVLVPMVCGDLYPFTSAPMFRDAPCQCCNYRVLAEGGAELPAAEWQVHRVYDGNPVGYGVGLRPPAVLEQSFGIVHDEAAVREHFKRQLARPEHAAHPSIVVVQERIGPVSSQRVGIVQTRQWRIGRK
jgi:hypothetical protein